MLKKTETREKNPQNYFPGQIYLAVTFRKLWSVSSFEYCIWTPIHNCSHQFTDNHLLGHYSHTLISDVKLKWQQTILTVEVKMKIAPLNSYKGYKSNSYPISSLHVGRVLSNYFHYNQICERMIYVGFHFFKICNISTYSNLALSVISPQVKHSFLSVSYFTWILLVIEVR